MNNRKRVGPRIDHCGTPECTSAKSVTPCHKQLLVCETINMIETILEILD